MNINGSSRAILLEYKGKPSQGRQAITPLQLPTERKEKSHVLKAAIDIKHMPSGHIAERRALGKRVRKFKVSESIFTFWAASKKKNMAVIPF